MEFPRIDREDSQFKIPHEAIENYSHHLIDRLQQVGMIEDEQLRPNQKLFIDSIVQRMMTDLSEMILSPFEDIQMKVAGRRTAWESELRSCFNRYENLLRKAKLKFCKMTREKSYPWFSVVDQVRQSLRMSSKSDDVDNQEKIKKRLDLMEYLIDYVDIESLSLLNFDPSKKTSNSVGYPFPHFKIPDKISRGLKLLSEGIQEIEMEINYWNPMRPLLPNNSDWFSRRSLDFTRNGNWYNAKLLGDVKANGCFCVQIQAPGIGYPSTTELLWFLSERLKCKIIGHHPSITRLDLSPNIGSHGKVIVCMGQQTNRGLILENNFRLGYCVVLCFDLGCIESYTLDQIYTDSDSESELFSIPPLSVECSFLPPRVRVDESDVDLLNSVFSKLIHYENKFMFHIVKCHNSLNARQVLQVYISREFEQITNRLMKMPFHAKRLSGNLCEDFNLPPPSGGGGNRSRFSTLGEEGHCNRSSFKRTTKRPMSGNKPHSRHFLKSKFKDLIAVEGMSHFVKSCLDIVRIDYPNLVNIHDGKPRRKLSDIRNTTLSNIECDVSGTEFKITPPVCSGDGPKENDGDSVRDISHHQKSGKTKGNHSGLKRNSTVEYQEGSCKKGRFQDQKNTNESSLREIKVELNQDDGLPDITIKKEVDSTPTSPY